MPGGIAIFAVVVVLVVGGVVGVIVWRRRAAAAAKAPSTPPMNERSALLKETQVADTSPTLVYNGL